MKEPVPLVDPKKGAFAVADGLLAHFDLDHDGRVSRDELAFAAIELFFSLDRNEDLKFTREEAGRFWNPHTKEVDANGDGAISLWEVLHDQERQFDVWDTDCDGFLSRSELRNFAANRLANGEGK